MKYISLALLLLLLGCDRPDLGAKTNLEQPEQNSQTAASSEYENPSDVGSTSDVNTSEGVAGSPESEASGLSALPDGRYTLVSQSKRLDDYEGYDYQKVRLEKSGSFATGMLVFSISDNLCFEGSVVGNRIVDIQTAKGPSLGDTWDGPYDGEGFAIEGSEYYTEPNDDEGSEIIDYCKDGFSTINNS